MIKITKQLNRPDGGIVPPNSLIDYTPRAPTGTLIMSYVLTHWLDQESKDDPKILPIASITNFKYLLNRECTEEEYSKLNDAGAADMVQDWLKTMIDDLIGIGNTEIV